MILVFLEVREGRIKKSSLEALSEGARRAGEMGAPLAAVVAGTFDPAQASDVHALGAPTLYHLESPELDRYSTQGFAQALAGLASEIKPGAVWMSATAMGRDLAPRVASQLRVGITADCTDLAIDQYTDPVSKELYKNILMQIRPAFGGNIIATIVNPRTRPQMATVREGVMQVLPPDAARSGNVVNIEHAPDAQDGRVAILERTRVEKTVNLKSSSVIVAGGAGVGNAENFKLIFSLASCLGASVGATRAAVDAGFIHRDHQVGQTGTTVRPRLYIACGISGAVQHRAGMSEARKIVAVNTDPEAPIFSVAHYGIVGDLKEVLPKMIRAYKSKSGGGAR